MDISNEAIDAALPFVGSFMERRGFVLRGQEADVLIGYVLEAAAPHMLAEVWDEGYTTGNAHNGRRDANPYRATP